jgi:hypothetical protein
MKSEDASDCENFWETLSMPMAPFRERLNSIQALNVLTTEVNYTNIINETFMI